MKKELIILNTKSKRDISFESGVITWILLVLVKWVTAESTSEKHRPTCVETKIVIRSDGSNLNWLSLNQPFFHKDFLLVRPVWHSLILMSKVDGWSSINSLLTHAKSNCVCEQTAVAYCCGAAGLTRHTLFIHVYGTARRFDLFTTLLIKCFIPAPGPFITQTLTDWRHCLRSE